MTRHDVHALAIALMRQHGLGPEWTFGFDRSVRRCGVCKRRGVRTAAGVAVLRGGHISLSVHYIARNSDELVRDTILHEIAHALVPPVRRGRTWDRHGIAWQTKAAEIGARPVRCKADAIMPAATNYHLSCDGCGTTWTQHRLSTAGRRYLKAGRWMHANCPKGKSLITCAEVRREPSAADQIVENFGPNLRALFGL